MREALRDFLKLRPQSWGMSQLASLEELVDFLTIQGVKVGGSYRHYKGDVYKVLDVVRDCDDWEGERLVVYVAVHDANHVAVRKLSEFLGDVDKPEYRGPRFRLLGMS